MLADAACGVEPTSRRCKLCSRINLLFRISLSAVQIHTYKFDEAGFSLYFLERPRDGTTLPRPGTPDAEKYLWNMKVKFLQANTKDSCMGKAQALPLLRRLIRVIQT